MTSITESLKHGLVLELLSRPVLECSFRRPIEIHQRRGSIDDSWVYCLDHVSRPNPMSALPLPIKSAFWIRCRSFEYNHVHLRITADELEDDKRYKT